MTTQQPRSALAAPLPLAVHRVTLEEACALAGRRLAEAVARRDALTVEEAARRAYSPDSGPSLPELERRIRARRSSQRVTAEQVAS